MCLQLGQEARLFGSLEKQETGIQNRNGMGTGTGTGTGTGNGNGPETVM